MFNIFKKKENNIQNSNKDGLPSVSENDMKRLHQLFEEKKQDYKFYETLQKTSIYMFPLESNTNLVPIADIIREMVSSLHYCIEAKKRLNLISEEFLASETYNKFMYKFTDGFMFDELDKFSNYSNNDLKNIVDNNNYLAYFYAYILKLINKLPEKKEDCDEIQLCSIITKVDNYLALFDCCQLLSKEQILYIADYLCLESIYFSYKKSQNQPYDESMQKYVGIQRTGAFFALSYDFNSMVRKLENINK